MYCQTAHPPPRPAEFSNKVAAAPAPISIQPTLSSPESKEWDPRWIGIFISGGLGLGSLLLQLFHRWWDKRRAREEAEFDQEIGDPLRECFGSLRALNSACSALPNLSKPKEINEAITKILHEAAPHALTPYASAATNADRLLRVATFSPLGVNLEDTIYTEIDIVKNATDARVRSISQRKISDAINEVIFKSSEELRRARAKYKCVQ
ncbi:hypothetical protein J2Y55_004590 [Bosea sp. BE125]|uniref:hypothetical protein n=1 Tax=Bosea sp. BE125 TaxID=2817909 RepID=UPI00285E992E|nr:hypothetical protein [Bosea sp. BE125]MDR6873563.1 hypothetical protein [Bosea sp. BE125]